MHIAFYKGQEGILDKLICLFTNHKYSHVELVTSITEDGVMSCIGSSHRERGVRQKRILYDAQKWDLIYLPWVDGDAAVKFCKAQCGKPYDYIGLLVSHYMNYETPDAWFCSELCARAIGVAQSRTYSPGGLYHLLCDIQIAVNQFSFSTQKHSIVYPIGKVQPQRNVG